MTSLFFTSFLTTFTALGKLFGVAMIAALLVRTRLVRQAHVERLSKLTIRLLLPCLIFSSLLTNFQPAALPFWWLIPVSAVLMVGFGMGAAALLFRADLPAKLNLLPLAGIQNAGYLVIALGVMLCPDQFDLFLVYCFLYMMGVSPMLWSVGKLFTTSGQGQAFRIRQMLTPPLLANLSAVSLVLTGVGELVPTELISLLTPLGNTTIPVAIFILGATIGAISGLGNPGWSDTLGVMAIKLLLLPLVTILVILCLGLTHSHPVLADLLVLQATAPAATNIILQVRAYGGDSNKVGAIMLYSYLASMVTIPLWLAVWRVVI